MLSAWSLATLTKAWWTSHELALGYDTAKLRKVPQRWPATAADGGQSPAEPARDTRGQRRASERATPERKVEGGGNETSSTFRLSPFLF